MLKEITLLCSQFYAANLFCVIDQFPFPKLSQILLHIDYCSGTSTISQERVTNKYQNNHGDCG